MRHGVSFCKEQWRKTVDDSLWRWIWYEKSWKGNMRKCLVKVCLKLRRKYHQNLRSFLYQKVEMIWFGWISLLLKGKYFAKRTLNCFDPVCQVWYIEDITRWREDMNFMFDFEILFLPREHKIHIFEPTCNVLFIIWRNQFNKSKRRESWRHWTIRHSQRWHTENTPLGSRMKWRMESTSGLVPSKTLSSI